MVQSYYEQQAKETIPLHLIKHCLVCSKKKNLVFYCSTKDFILQICNKCWEERTPKFALPKGNKNE